MQATAALPSAVKLSSQRATASSNEAEIEALAQAYNDALNDTDVRTMHDAARCILAKLEEAGSPLGFRGRRPLDFDAIEMALHAVSTIAIKIEMIGRCAVDDVHAEKLDEVFDSVRADLEQQVARLKASLGMAKEVQQ